MSRSKRDILDTERMLERLAALLREQGGGDPTAPGPYHCHEHAEALRRISMTLRTWFEHECNGAIQRDEKWAIERCAHPKADRARWWDGDTKWVQRAQRRTYDEYEKTEIMRDLPTTRPWNSADFAKANAQGFPSEGAWRETGCKPYQCSADGVMRYQVPDREAGALKRLKAIMARYPALQAYVQTDPRGCALYILKPGDVPDGADVSSYYSRGLAVYR